MPAAYTTHLQVQWRQSYPFIFDTWWLCSGPGPHYKEVETRHHWPYLRRQVIYDTYDEWCPFTKELSTHLPTGWEVTNRGALWWTTRTAGHGSWWTVIVRTCSERTSFSDTACDVISIHGHTSWTATRWRIPHTLWLCCHPSNSNGCVDLWFCLTKEVGGGGGGGGGAGRWGV